MFAFAYQTGTYLEIFDSRISIEKDKAYLNLYKIEQPTQSQKIADKILKGHVLEIQGSGNRIKFPKSEKPGLGLTQRYLVLQIYVPNPANWQMELIISDQGKNKRVSFSSSAKDVEKKQCNLIVPTSNLIQGGKWINLQIDCPSFIETSSSEFILLLNKYGSSIFLTLDNKFKSLESIILQAPCKIRRIFTSKILLNQQRKETQVSEKEIEEIPKQLHLPADAEADTILLSLPSIMSQVREKNQVMGFTLNSNFGESLCGSESSSIQGMSQIQFGSIKKQSGCESDKEKSVRNSYISTQNQSKKEKFRIGDKANNLCEPIQELPNNKQSCKTREFSSPVISESSKQTLVKQRYKYPLPPSSSSSNQSKQQQQQAFYGKGSTIQDEDNKDLQTTAVSDLRGSINTLYNSKQRSALSPTDLSCSETQNQISNGSASAFNSTDNRKNSKISKQNTLNIQKSNNLYKMTAQSRSPKGAPSASTTSTTSATKSNPWSTNVYKSNKLNFASGSSALDSFDSNQAGKSCSELTPDRQKLRSHNEAKLNSRQIKEKGTINMNKNQGKGLQPLPQRPQVSLDGPSPKLKSRQQEKIRSISKNILQPNDAEYLEMSQKFSTVGDPRLFQLDNLFGSSTDQETKKHSKQLPSSTRDKSNKSKQTKAKQPLKPLPQEQLQPVRKQEIQSKRKKEPIEQTKNKQQQNDNIFNHDEIEEEIETESKIADQEIAVAYESENSQSKSHCLDLQRNNRLLYSNNMNCYEGESDIDHEKKKVINQNSTGLSFTKPNLAFTKRSCNNDNPLTKTQENPLHFTQENGIHNNKIHSDKIKPKADDKKQSQKGDLIFSQAQEADEEDIPIRDFYSGYSKLIVPKQQDHTAIGECSEENTLRQTQTKFFKDQICNAMNQNLRPFTPPFNQVPCSQMSSSQKSTKSYQKKSLQQGEEQIEVIYDDVLNCYYDPKTHQYFDLKS